MSDEPNVCAAWGPLQPDRDRHMDCPVVVTVAHEATSACRGQALPALCGCQCRTCSRAWWAADRPTWDGDQIKTKAGRVLAERVARA